MTFDEQQEFKVLSLLKGRHNRILIGEIEDALNEDMGGGLWTVLTRLEERRFINKGDYAIGDPRDGVSNPGFIINKSGERHLNYLIKKKRKNFIKEVAFWILFVSALVAGIDVGIKWFSKEKEQPSKDVQIPQLNPTPNQPTKVPSQKEEHDSIFGYPNNHDSLTMKKNETKYKDTAALRNTSVDKTHKPKKK